MDHSIVMPFALFVAEWDYNSRLYDDNGVRMLIAPPDGRSHGKVSTYTTDLYVQCLNLTDGATVTEFIDAHPSLLLLHGSGQPENCVSYSARVVSQVTQHRSIVLLGQKLSAYSTHPDASHLRAVCEQYLDSPIRALVDHNKMQIADCPKIKLFRDLVLRILAGYLPPKQIADSIISAITPGYKAFISKHLRHCYTIYDIDSSQIHYICDTVLAAMYMQHFVDLFSQHQYRQCAHKGCTSYFLVNRSHPQTMCPTHMLSRQRKRQKQRLKDAIDDAASWSFLDDDE